MESVSFIYIIFLILIEKRSKMKKAEMRLWEKDIEYYDKKSIEVNTLFKLTNFKNKKVLDVGCGIARLTLPLAKYAKEIIAVDKDKDIINYNKSHKKRKNIDYILSDIREFKEKEFDIALLAQPSYNNFDKNLLSINNALKKKGKLIVVRWIDKEKDYNSLLTPFWDKDKKLMKKVKGFSKYFIKTIKNHFKIKKIKLIKTYYSYPNEQLLIKNIINDSPKKFTEKDFVLLNKLLEKYSYKKINISMKAYLCEKN